MVRLGKMKHPLKHPHSNDTLSLIRERAKLIVLVFLSFWAVYEASMFRQQGISKSARVGTHVGPLHKRRIRAFGDVSLKSQQTSSSTHCSSSNSNEQICAASLLESTIKSSVDNESHQWLRAHSNVTTAVSEESSSLLSSILPNVVGVLAVDGEKQRFSQFNRAPIKNPFQVEDKRRKLQNEYIVTETETKRKLQGNPTVQDCANQGSVYCELIPEEPCMPSCNTCADKTTVYHLKICFVPYSF